MASTRRRGPGPGPKTFHHSVERQKTEKTLSETQSQLLDHAGQPAMQALEFIERAEQDQDNLFLDGLVALYKAKVALGQDTGDLATRIESIVNDAESLGASSTDCARALVAIGKPEGAQAQIEAIGNDQHPISATIEAYADLIDNTLNSADLRNLLDTLIRRADDIAPDEYATTISHLVTQLLKKGDIDDALYVAGQTLAKTPKRDAGFILQSVADHITELTTTNDPHRTRVLSFLEQHSAGLGQDNMMRNIHAEVLTHRGNTDTALQTYSNSDDEDYTRQRIFFAAVATGDQQAIDRLRAEVLPDDNDKTYYQDALHYAQVTHALSEGSLISAEELARIHGIADKIQETLHAAEAHLNIEKARVAKNAGGKYPLPPWTFRHALTTLESGTYHDWARGGRDMMEDMVALALDSGGSRTDALMDEIMDAWDRVNEKMNHREGISHYVSSSKAVQEKSRLLWAQKKAADAQKALSQDERSKGQVTRDLNLLAREGHMDKSTRAALEHLRNEPAAQQSLLELIGVAQENMPAAIERERENTYKDAPIADEPIEPPASVAVTAAPERSVEATPITNAGNVPDNLPIEQKDEPRPETREFLGRASQIMAESMPIIQAAGKIEDYAAIAARCLELGFIADGERLSADVIAAAPNMSELERTKVAGIFASHGAESAAARVAKILAPEHEKERNEWTVERFFRILDEKWNRAQRIDMIRHELQFLFPPDHSTTDEGSLAIALHVPQHWEKIPQGLRDEMRQRYALNYMIGSAFTEHDQREVLTFLDSFETGRAKTAATYDVAKRLISMSAGVKDEMVLRVEQAIHIDEEQESRKFLSGWEGQPQYAHLAESVGALTMLGKKDYALALLNEAITDTDANPRYAINRAVSAFGDAMARTAVRSGERNLPHMDILNEEIAAIQSWTQHPDRAQEWAQRIKTGYRAGEVRGLIDMNDFTAVRDIMAPKKFNSETLRARTTELHNIELEELGELFAASAKKACATGNIQEMAQHAFDATEKVNPRRLLYLQRKVPRYNGQRDGYIKKMMSTMERLARGISEQVGRLDADELPRRIRDLEYLLEKMQWTADNMSFAEEREKPEQPDPELLHSLARAKVHVSLAVQATLVRRFPSLSNQ